MHTTRPPTAGTTGKKPGIKVKHKAPALEAALAAFTTELRRELQEASEAIAALRTELDALRAHYEVHTHTYHRTITGDKGHLWMSLGAIRGYVAQDQTPWDDYGLYMRGAPLDSNKNYDFKTSPPSTT